MSSYYLSVHEAKSFDLVAYLDNLGHQPIKIRGNDYWYYSPLRQERTPSFKVNRKLNVWYDHGIGKGGNLVDFGVLFYGCPVKEFLQKLEEKTALNFSFHPPYSASQITLEPEEKKLLVTTVNPISSLRFYHYLRQRNIDLDIAKQHLKEVTFALNGRLFTALGFENNSGGFELRNEHFKGSSSPKDITLIDKKSEVVSVFEGCFSFLSYQVLLQKYTPKEATTLSEGQTNFLVLNSLSFFEKSRSAMEAYSTIQLYLDRDGAGLKATQQALNWSQKYIDKSVLYSQHKDLNGFIIHQHKVQRRQSLPKGRHL